MEEKKEEKDQTLKTKKKKCWEDVMMDDEEKNGYVSLFLKSFPLSLSLKYSNVETQF
jgi:hypothetical protein